jgi:hypothetical protein
MRESPQHLRRSQAGLDDLQRHDASRLKLLGLIDRAHSTSAQEIQNSVAGNIRRRCRAGSCRSNRRDCGGIRQFNGLHQKAFGAERFRRVVGDFGAALRT